MNCTCGLQWWAPNISLSHGLPVREKHYLFGCCALFWGTWTGLILCVFCSVCFRCGRRNMDGYIGTDTGDIQAYPARTLSRVRLHRCTHFELWSLVGFVASGGVFHTGQDTTGHEKKSWRRVRTQSKTKKTRIFNIIVITCHEPGSLCCVRARHFAFTARTLANNTTSPQGTGDVAH